MIKTPAADPRVRRLRLLAAAMLHPPLVWGLPYRDPGSAVQASGGGFSRLFPRPGYQDGVPGIRATREWRARSRGT